MTTKISLGIQPALFETLRSLAFGAIGAAFTDLGSPLDSPARLFKIVNTTDADLEVSYDGGATLHDIVPRQSFVLYDEATNGLIFPRFTQVAVRRLTVPTSGTAYVVAVHARSE